MCPLNNSLALWIIWDSSLVYNAQLGTEGLKIAANISRAIVLMHLGRPIVEKLHKQC